MKFEKNKIMIVDSTHQFCTDMKNALVAFEQFDVVNISTNAFKALENIPLLQPHFVLFDLMHPDMDGITFLKNAMQKTKNSETMYIATTKMYSVSDMQKVIEAGASYYLVKADNCNTLAEIIFSLCQKNNAAEFEDNNSEPETSVIKATEQQITDIIIGIGITANLNGYHYLRQAIALAMSYPNMNYSITKEIYPTIAKNNNTTTAKVERAIRHAITNSWNSRSYRKQGTLDSLLFYNQRKPTNSEFIACIADMLQLKRKDSVMIGR